MAPTGGFTGDDVSMKILVVGGGGREHALCWAVAASPLVDHVYCAPGNAGLDGIAECLAIPVDDIDGLTDFARSNSVDLVIVGPEMPLVLGLVDRLESVGIRGFGPRANAAVLEGSKGFMKDFCRRHDIPTAAYGRFADAKAAHEFIAGHGGPLVVKADGLAAGKGVVICSSAEEAHTAVENMVTGGQYGAAGREVVIEEFLEGEEASFFVLVDGTHALPFASAQDHKRVGDGDKGPNTGGMGAYSPAAVITDEVSSVIMDSIIKPTVNGMRSEDRPYTGVLYAGLMLTRDGPRLLEFNARFGDPECQVLMMRLMSDPVPAFIAACDGELTDFDLRWHDAAALTVVMAADGYPGPCETGSVISGIDAADALDDVMVFHAGTKRGADGEVIANGGRVLNVSAFGPSLAQARRLAYKGVDCIDWPEGFCRRDIGARVA